MLGGVWYVLHVQRSSMVRRGSPLTALCKTSECDGVVHPTAAQVREDHQGHPGTGPEARERPGDQDDWRCKPECQALGSHYPSLECSQRGDTSDMVRRQRASCLVLCHHDGTTHTFSSKGKTTISTSAILQGLRPRGHAGNELQQCEAPAQACDARLPSLSLDFS